MLHVAGHNQASPNPQSAVPLLGRLGSLETRIAENYSETKAAQSLRYQVFCDEMSASIGLVAGSEKREADSHDSRCDHLLVIDKSDNTKQEIVGTQRFFLKNGARSKGTFYSQKEFNVDALVERHPNYVFMELGRSCILPEYRVKRTMELMWQGTWAYALNHHVDVMLGCASFHTTDVAEIGEALGFLSKHAPAIEAWQVDANSRDSIEISAFETQISDDRAALRKLPPLIKGYLRLGAMFSAEAVPDPDFGTIDVLVVLPVEKINPKYVNYYGEDASKHRA